MPNLSATGIFPEHDVANPVQAVFDAPVTDPVGEQLAGIRAIRGETGDRVLHLDGFFTASKGGPLQAENLLKPRPVQRFRQAAAGLEMPRHDAAMPLLRAAHFAQCFSPLALARGGKIPARTRLGWQL